MRSLPLLRGLVFLLLLSGGSTAFAEESLILNRKGKFSIPHNHQYSQASIVAIHAGEFDIRSANKYKFSTVDTNDLWELLSRHSLAYASGKLNEYVEDIPFLLHSSFGLGFTSDGETNVSADAMLKVIDFGNDESGDILGLAFVHTKYKTHFDSGTTLNLGLGFRKRTNDYSMYGLNTYWDYKMTNYSSAHSRFGLGAEYFWKDLSLRNNWYMSGTGVKSITVDGTDYYERVVPGWDVEVGYRLPFYPSLAFYLKGFNWDYKYRNDNSGVKATVAWQATPHFGLNAWASNEIPSNATSADSDLDNQQSLVVGVNFVLTANKVEYKPSYKDNLLQEMKNPVRRRYDVLVERYTEDTAAGWNAKTLAK